MLDPRTKIFVKTILIEETAHVLDLFATFTSLHLYGQFRKLKFLIVSLFIDNTRNTFVSL